MSIQTNFSYKPPLFLSNGHLQTIYPTFLRKLDHAFYQRERITTPDDDFLDLDWSCKGNNRLAILSHGLEGSSFRPYMVGMVLALNKCGWDALAWNYRSCSGEINRQLRFYHNGATDDLDIVVEHACKKGLYKSIALIGFSMGGNLSLVYLGEKGKKIHSLISKSIVFSVPCDLEASAAKLAHPLNMIYMRRFLRMLHKKVTEKMRLFPDRISDDGYEKIKDFKGFDDRYTAPIHGFKNAEDYWRRCSSNNYIPGIKIKTLIINAANDPFLSEECFPIKQTKDHQYVSLEIPKSGGHVGFESFNAEGMYWSEKRALQFLNTD